MASRTIGAVGESGDGAGNLPAATASFIGRRGDLAEVRRRLRRSRLVTIAGSGGVGKTRVALEAASALRREYADGVWFVDLAPVGDGTRVADAVASALGVLDASARPATDRLTDHLSDREALLVVDNCEHLLVASAVLVERLLRAAPGLRVVATSREPLGVAGEHVHALAPLAEDEAVQLLEERVAAVRSDGFADAGDRARARRLCDRLDRNPLAIELAATRLRSLSLEELIVRLDDRFAVLTKGASTAVPRQQSLRALIDWSHALCSPAERLMWARMAVFAGSFDLRACEVICSGDGVEEADVLELLDRLVARSIVICEHRSDGSRFRLLETIRAYGREQLDAAATEAVRDRHLAFYLARASAIADAWCGPDQRAGLALLRADHDNLRLALERSCETEAGAALELTAALRQHWYSDGYLAEGRRWLERALERPVGGAARAQALWVAAWVALLQGDHRAARMWLDECEALSGPADPSRSYALMLRGTTALFTGSLTVAVDRFREAIVHAVTTQADAAMLAAAFQLGHALAQLGQLDAADEVCRDGLVVSERQNERWARCALLWTLGYVAWLRGDLAGAQADNDRALELQRGFHDGVLTALSVELAAWIAASRGRADRAAELLAAAESVWTEMGTSIAAFGPSHVEHHDRCVHRIGRARRKPRRLSIDDALDIALALPSSSEPAADLTRREWEVAQLVAQGMTNRAIAAQLVLSHRTVDGHLEHILAKLGFESRSQVAAWTAEQRATVRNG
jgi:predicted ATPase/DNA-binding CsgD family transcriptional regulator